MELEDNEYEDRKITGVEKYPDGSYEISHDGWCFLVPGSTPIEPKAGMVARFYGKGFGSRVRGLEIDGVRVFYRTEAEDKEQAEIELYGADVADWLARWDSGRSVWTIEMGGLGPGYEQAIQCTLVTILKHMVAEKYDHTRWSNTEAWKADRERIEKWSFADPTIKELGLSGAMWGAALNLATHFYMHGPRKVLNDARVKDRHIQVSKDWPKAA